MDFTNKFPILPVNIKDVVFIVRIESKDCFM